MFFPSILSVLFVSHLLFDSFVYFIRSYYFFRSVKSFVYFYDFVRNEVCMLIHLLLFCLFFVYFFPTSVVCFCFTWSIYFWQNNCFIMFLFKSVLSIFLSEQFACLFVGLLLFYFPFCFFSPHRLSILVFCYYFLRRIILVCF